MQLHSKNLNHNPWRLRSSILLVQWHCCCRWTCLLNTWVRCAPCGFKKLSKRQIFFRILVAFFREKRHRNYLERRNGSYSKKFINSAQPSLCQRRLGLISHEILAQKNCLLVSDFHLQTGIRAVRVRTLTPFFNLHRFPVLVGTEDHQSVRFA